MFDQPLQASEPGLASIARRKGIIYGAAVSARQLATDSGYRALVQRHCAVVVPEWEMKWRAIEPRRGSRDYTQIDAILDFASGNNMRVRGHTAVWHRGLPDWVPGALRGEQGSRVMSAHIQDIVRRYASELNSFDIVNEAINPKDGNSQEFRQTPYFQAFGTNYVAAAFAAASEAAPNLKLYYNDLELDYDDPNCDAQRAAVLMLLQRLKDEGVAIHGLGIQGHLRVSRNYSALKHRQFLANVASLGLEITITEFDVNDSSLPADPTRRDQEIAAHAKAYLDTAFDEQAVAGLITWGMTSKYSWLNESAPHLRRDRHLTRGLPFDATFKKTGLFDALVAALEGAPLR